MTVVFLFLILVAIVGFVKYAQTNINTADRDAGLVAAIFGTLAFIVLLAVVIVMRKRIKFAIALIKESSR